MACCRQATPELPPPKGHWKLNSTVGILKGPTGLSTHYGRLFAPLQGGHILESLRVPPTHEFSLAAQESSWTLVEKTEAGELQMGEIPESLASILQRVRPQAVTEDSLIQTVLSLGADTEEEALEVLHSLEEDGLLLCGK